MDNDDDCIGEFSGKLTKKPNSIRRKDEDDVEERMIV